MSRASRRQPSPEPEPLAELPTIEPSQVEVNRLINAIPRPNKEKSHVKKRRSRRKT
jgi:hypothetical protein